MDTGKLIAQIRQQKGLTQKDLATVSSWVQVGTKVHSSAWCRLEIDCGGVSGIDSCSEAHGNRSYESGLGSEESLASRSRKSARSLRSWTIMRPDAHYRTSRYSRKWNGPSVWSYAVKTKVNPSEDRRNPEFIEWKMNVYQILRAIILSTSRCNSALRVSLQQSRDVK